MVNIPHYVQSKLKEVNTEKIQWKIIGLYFAVLSLYVLILYGIAKVMDSGEFSVQFFSPIQQKNVIYPTQSPLPHIIYSIIWPALQGLLLVILGWFSATKLLKIPKGIISIPALINLFFFSKLTAWFLGLPLLLLGWLAAIPMIISPSISSLTIDFNLRVITPLYAWITALAYGTLLVTGIVYAVQSQKEKTVE